MSTNSEHIRCIESVTHVTENLLIILSWNMWHFLSVAQQPDFVLHLVLVRNPLKPSIQGFGGETWGKETTWETQA